MPNKGGKRPDGSPARAKDPRSNAGISLTRAQVRNLDDFKERAKLPSRSAVVDLLLERGMPILWAELLRQESKG